MNVRQRSKHYLAVALRVDCSKSYSPGKRWVIGRVRSAGAEAQLSPPALEGVGDEGDDPLVAVY